MSDRIALQLYTVRDLAAQDYEGVVRKVAAMGYQGVETAGFPGTNAEAAAKLFKELGLEVAAAHTGLPLGERKNQILEDLEALGKPTLVCTQIGPNDVVSMDAIKDLCDRLNEGYEVAKANGIEYAIHNHWWEFGRIDGRLVHHVMLEHLNPEVSFEIDTYWVQVGGEDAAEIVRSLGARVPLLHIKDGSGVKEDPMVAVGEGVMNFPKILEASGDNAKWLIVELDRCATDILPVVQKSYNYLANL
jgi:sugar phosphate isomerase/epimerase